MGADHQGDCTAVITCPLSSHIWPYRHDVCLTTDVLSLDNGSASFFITSPLSKQELIVG